MNGETAAAVPLLRAGMASRVGMDSPATLKLDPVWDRIRGDAGFQALLR
jgi:hypothetical protein